MDIIIYGDEKIIKLISVPAEDIPGNEQEALMQIKKRLFDKGDAE